MRRRAQHGIALGLRRIAGAHLAADGGADDAGFLQLRDAARQRLFQVESMREAEVIFSEYLQSEMTASATT